MRTKHKNKHAVAKAILFLFVILAGVGTYIAHFAKGHDASPLSPRGTVAAEQSHLIYLSAGIVLAVAVPTLLVLYFFAWKYRETNNHVSYKPETHHGKGFVFAIWAFPTLIMVVLASILIPVTHRLSPKTAALNGVQPITIQVIALRWKWLFLYPEQQIATVNTLTIPKDRPVIFELTADNAPMSSFWIPNLGGQLYAMTGHVNRLNLVGTDIGSYPGRSAEINGEGFAGMKFTANVTSKQDFSYWTDSVKSGSNELNDTIYSKLRGPSEDQPATNYSGYDSDLYDKVVMKYMNGHAMHGTSSMSGMDMNSMDHEGHN